MKLNTFDVSIYHVREVDREGAYPVARMTPDPKNLHETNKIESVAIVEARSTLDRAQSRHEEHRTRTEEARRWRERLTWRIRTRNPARLVARQTLAS